MIIFVEDILIHNNLYYEKKFNVLSLKGKRKQQK